MAIPIRYIFVDIMLCFITTAVWHRIGYSFDMHWRYKFNRGVGAILAFGGLLGLSLMILVLFFSPHEFMDKIWQNGFITALSILALFAGANFMLEYSIQRYRRA